MPGYFSVSMHLSVTNTISFFPVTCHIPALTICQPVVAHA
ncbi:hypothetical protein BACPEC_02889 [[Bacteroides] pectinophilus ATCC 43243]|uniref:Uncharacterized protein n=1 Tax=[Bacteroides] pectinophilus ATCC 43243 TaxID=483218 RepID=B7AVY9_9FIRM|nr:hypothetical protein BACPEC_02889 [[Bacteroides] pectinophilus ATCC 43243]